MSLLGFSLLLGALSPVIGSPLAFMENHYRSEECIYFPPSQSPSEDLFQRLRLLSQGETSSFANILELLQQGKTSYHRFEFKYPIANRELAEKMRRVLKIKAYEAHRYVPVIEHCQYLAPCHLGFLREITVHGTKILERVLLDEENQEVIFIEENGPFAAHNQILEEGGNWYFVGIYLYDQVDDVQKTKAVFDSTYWNMLKFASSEKSDLQ